MGKRNRQHQQQQNQPPQTNGANSNGSREPSQDSLSSNGQDKRANSDHINGNPSTQQLGQPELRATETRPTRDGDNRGDDGTGESPLRLFGEAKDKINCLYSRLHACVDKAAQFYSSQTEVDPEVRKQIDTDRLQRLNKSIETIRNVLSRNQMKVAFFGRTSNGKSTVINAILHDRVLPMGYGHTTGCFLQIEGNQKEEAFMEVQKNGQSDERRPVESVAHIANALNSSDALEYSTLVKIHWPISKCPLLKYDVVLVDSPGVDVEENLDDWIDEHCHDADVFVLVSNAESTLNIAEKNFFFKVSEKLSKPNIFILNNRWDSIADDPDSMEQVKRQHMERAVTFLCDELNISTRDEAKQRTFFVSAREILQARSHQASPSKDSLTQREGYLERSEEFKNFERRFEESLSRSAVKTKFKKHTDKGKETVNELNDILRSTLDFVSKAGQLRCSELNNNEERKASIESLFYKNEEALVEEILAIKKRVQHASYAELGTEIKRLSRAIDDFEDPFSPQPEKLLSYKQKLYKHIEEALGENLKSKVTSIINKQVNPFNKVMCDISLLLSEGSQRRIRTIVESQAQIPDELFDLKIYRQFYTDFQEDLEFRFSLGIVSLVRRFQARFSKNAVGVKSTTSSAEHLTPEKTSETISGHTDALVIFERFLMNPPQSPTTIGSLAVGGVLVRTVGWRVIIVTTVIYGALYAYEYLTWTNSAKERTFKAQYVKYARKGLHDCSPIISQHIANSVEQKLCLTFNKVKKEVDSEQSQINEKITLLKTCIDKLLVCDKFARELLGDSDVIMNELTAFVSSFLSF